MKREAMVVNRIQRAVDTYNSASPEPVYVDEVRLVGGTVLGKFTYYIRFTDDERLFGEGSTIAEAFDDLDARLCRYVARREVA